MNISSFPFRCCIALGAGLLASSLLSCNETTTSTGRDLNNAGSSMLSMAGVSVAGVDVGRSFSAASKIASSQKEFSTEDEHYLGRAVSAQIIADAPILSDSAATRYLCQIGQALAAVSEMPSTYDGYHFLILDSDEINAYSAPGGIVLVARGLIRCCSDEDQLAAALAHEIAHLQNRDGVQSIKDNKFWSGVTEGGIAAAVSAGGAGGAAANQFGDMLGNFAVTVRKHEYGKDVERKSDSDALLLMRRVGYDGRAMVQLLQTMKSRIQQAGKDNKKLAAMHPDLDERIGNANSQLASLPGGSADPVRKTRFEAAMAGVLKK